MNETSPLLSSTNMDDSIVRGDVVPKFINDPRLKKKHFKYAIPSQESEAAMHDRFFSVKICYVVMFFSAVSFTITISSMWPFLQIIDPTTETAFFGWIVSAFSVGQLLASPMFGFWANRISCHKIPILVCLVVTIVGNVIYMYLESVDTFKAGSPKMWMLFSRFIMGAGASAAAVIRSYVSSATNIEERTSVLANISACQGLGFIIGPVLQAAMVPFGYPGVITSPILHLNLYTSPALLNIIVHLLILFAMIYKFNEYVVLDNKTIDLNQIFESNSIAINAEDSFSDSIRNLPPPDYIAVALALILFFINCFVFSFYETLSSPLTIDMYAWTKKEAAFYNGLILGGLGVFAVVIVLISKIMARRVKEKTLMLVGYIVLFVSVAALLPWGNEYPSFQIQTMGPGEKNVTTTEPFNSTTTTTTTLTPKTTEDPRRGCPLDYEWCFYTPIIKLYQFIIGFILLVSGYSVANVMSFTIYSKLLGPKPQGTMMGLLTSCGSLSRAVGPVVVSYLYGMYGPRVSFITLDVIILVAILIIVVTFKRYEPYKFS